MHGLIRKPAAIAAIAATALGGAALALAGVVGVSAQTPTTSPTPQASGTAPAGTFRSNEDPTHEGTESAEREAAEDSGQFRGHGGGTNEDSAHEANETAEQEAAEHAGKSTQSGQSPSSSFKVNRGGARTY